MIKSKNKIKRQFVHLSRAWYGDVNLKLESDVVDRINVGFYHQDGGTTGEFTFAWEKLAGRIVPRLHAFDDGWRALHGFSDLIEAMAKVDGQNISPDEFCKLLVSLGIQDVTPEECAHD